MLGSTLSLNSWHLKHSKSVLQSGDSQCVSFCEHAQCTHVLSRSLSLKHSLETGQAAGSACPRLGAHREKPEVSEMAGDPGEQSGQPLTLVGQV